MSGSSRKSALRADIDVSFVGRLCGVSADYHYTKGSEANYAIVPSADLILLELALLQTLDELHDRSNRQSLCYRERPVLTS
jgi:hypothetical protein